MFKWLHHILQPHCEHCKEEAYEAKLCQSCEVLKTEIERLRIENTRLLDSLLTPKTDVEANREMPKDLKPIVSATIPWKIRRNMLETADKHTAELRRKAEVAEAGNKTSSNDVSDLEKEILEA